MVGERQSNVIGPAERGKRIRYITAPAGAHVKAGYYAFEDSNVDPSVRGMINRREVLVDKKARAAANEIALKDTKV